MTALLRDKIILTHQLRKEVQAMMRVRALSESLVPGDYLITLQDHLSKPQISVHDPEDIENSVAFEVSRDSITVVDSEHFTGDLSEAIALVEKVINQPANPQ